MIGTPSQGTNERAPSAAADTRYWSGEYQKVASGPGFDAWYRYMNLVYARLTESWGPCEDQPSRFALKTDLFEEAVTRHAPLANLPPPRLGIDVSLDVVRSARRNMSATGTRGQFVVCDVRHLPFRSGRIGFILSGSTLDHFSDRRELSAGLAELCRALAPGGRMILTLDNPHNPLIWLRNRLLAVQSLRMFSYKVGVTLSCQEAHAELRSLGLSVVGSTAVAHAPRDPAMRLVRIVEGLGWQNMAAAVARGMEWFEPLMHLPTRHKTGYYLAFCAVKPVSADEPAEAGAQLLSRPARAGAG